jgi:hypothetical protein
VAGDGGDRDRFDELYERLELLADLDDLTLGGAGGLATGVEIVADGLHRGPGDPLDAFESLRDLSDGTDVFDDLF